MVIDPCKVSTKSDYFDPYLPLIKNDDNPEEFKVAVYEWFSQYDSDRLLY